MRRKKTGRAANKGWRSVVGKAVAVCTKCGVVKELTATAFEGGKVPEHYECGGAMVKSRTRPKERPKAG